tara:strand:- start:14018 stop:14143 length:126 start_codon:yes stop_codon:yes gene_type:complete
MRAKDYDVLAHYVIDDYLFYKGFYNQIEDFKYLFSFPLFRG